MVDLPTAGRFVGGAGYAPLTDTSLRALVSGIPVCRDLLKGDPTDWEIREVGDGNLNLVFIVTSGADGVAVKQALPYVRLVGESWPLPLDRAHFEHEALKIQAAYADACSEGVSLRTRAGRHRHGLSFAAHHPAQRINPPSKIPPTG
jgi:hypothetical protein